MPQTALDVALKVKQSLKQGETQNGRQAVDQLMLVHPEAEKVVIQP